MAPANFLGGTPAVEGGSSSSSAPAPPPAVPEPPIPDDVPEDALQSVPDIICEECEGESTRATADQSIWFRSRSKAALIEEAKSPKHLMNHYPHNPYCEVCVRSHMRQRSFNRTKEKTDEEEKSCAN